MSLEKCNARLWLPDSYLVKHLIKGIRNQQRLEETFVHGENVFTTALLLHRPKNTMVTQPRKQIEKSDHEENRPDHDTGRRSAGEEQLNAGDKHKHKAHADVHPGSMKAAGSRVRRASGSKAEKDGKRERDHDARRKHPLQE